MNLRILSDEELLRRAYAELDALTSTDLERELLRRFEEFAPSSPLLEKLDDLGIDKPEQLEELALRGQEVADFTKGFAKNIFDIADEFDIDSAEDLHAQLELAAVLTEFDIDDVSTLRKQLDRVTKLDQTLQDLVAPLQTLQTLAIA